MRILAVSDEECDALWDLYVPGRLKEYDLILSCGDLHASYLSFLVTMARCPVLYVHGNHDIGYGIHGPDGCDCIEDRLVVVNGLRVLGLGGCMRYHPGDHQYTEREMARRVRRLKWQILRCGGVDIVVTHAPPQGLGDAEDYPHRGFESLVRLIDRYHPQYLLHGHVHLRYGPNVSRIHQRGGTRIINCCERYALDVEPGPREYTPLGRLLSLFPSRKQRLY